jgi:hypothetical protein
MIHPSGRSAKRRKVDGATPVISTLLTQNMNQKLWMRFSIPNWMMHGLLHTKQSLIDYYYKLWFVKFKILF